LPCRKSTPTGQVPMDSALGSEADLRGGGAWMMRLSTQAPAAKAEQQADEPPKEAPKAGRRKTSGFGLGFGLGGGDKHKVRTRQTASLLIQTSPGVSARRSRARRPMSNEWWCVRTRAQSADVAAVGKDGAPRQMGWGTEISNKPMQPPPARAGRRAGGRQPEAEYACPRALVPSAGVVHHPFAHLLPSLSSSAVYLSSLKERCRWQGKISCRSDGWDGRELRVGD
jgi:hypothetical protein